MARQPRERGPDDQPDLDRDQDDEPGQPDEQNSDATGVVRGQQVVHGDQRGDRSGHLQHGPRDPGG